MKCTQYGLHGQETFKNARTIMYNFIFRSRAERAGTMGFIRAVKGSPGQMWSSPEPWCQSTEKLSFSMLNLGNGCSTCVGLSCCRNSDTFKTRILSNWPHATQLGSMAQLHTWSWWVGMMWVKLKQAILSYPNRLGGSVIVQWMIRY